MIKITDKWGRSFKWKLGSAPVATGENVHRISASGMELTAVNRVSPYPGRAKELLLADGCRAKVLAILVGAAK